MFFYSNRKTRGGRLWKVAAAGGEPEQLTSGRAFVSRTSLDGKRIFFQGRREQSGNIWAVSLEDGAEYPVTNLEGRPGSVGIGLATDGEHLYFTWGMDVSNLWAMDVVRE